MNTLKTLGGLTASPAAVFATTAPEKMPATIRLTGLNLPTPPPAPTLRPMKAADLTPEQGRRLLLNQVLVSHLQSNTYELLSRFRWQDLPPRMVNGLAERVGQFYDRYYERNREQEAVWLNNVVNLSEGATVAILALAVEGNPIKTARLGELLTQLAQLAGTLAE